MPFIPVPFCWEARLNFLVGNAEQMVNVLHFYNVTGTPLTAGLAGDLADAIHDAWVADLQDRVGADVSFTDVTVKDISEPDRPAFPISMNEVGTAVDALLPFGTALVATLYTDVGSRGGRGRVFLGGFTEAANVGDDLADAAVAADAKTFVDALMDLTLTSSDPDTVVQLAVASRHAHVGGDPGGEAIEPVANPVTHTRVNRRWDTQRRRGNKIRV